MAKNEQQSHEIWLNVYFFSCISLKVSTEIRKSHTCDAKELPQRRCPIYPKALGIFAQHPEAFSPIVPGTVPHCVGHDSS